MIHRIHQIAAAGLLVALVSTPAAAQLPTGPQLLITPQAASKFLNDPKTIFLQVGEKASYEKEHVPGAQFVTLDMISSARGGPLSLEMPSADSLKTALEKLGISDDSRVVVMFSDEWGSPSTRVLFTLGYAGLAEKAVLMDGGVEAWKAAKLPLTAAVVAPRPGHITRSIIPSLVVDYKYVQAMKPNGRSKLVDARDSVFFVGPSTSTQMKAGHIPGAVSLPFSTFTDDSMRIVAPATIVSRFRAAGIAAGDTVVAYCHIGQQGTMLLWAARVAGHPVKLYDGSMDDWNKRGFPIDSVPAKSTKGNSPK